MAPRITAAYALQRPQPIQPCATCALEPRGPPHCGKRCARVASLSLVEHPSRPSGPPTRT
eukprot:15468832-Alexandrium_andersonii.AAC.1